MTPEERKIRTHGAFLRRRFDHHSEVIRSIVANLSDEQLIAMEAENHENRVRQLEAQRRDTRLGKVVARAMDTPAQKLEKSDGGFRENNDLQM